MMLYSKCTLILFPVFKLEKEANTKPKVINIEHESQPSGMDGTAIAEAQKRATTFQMLTS